MLCSLFCFCIAFSSERYNFILILPQIKDETGTKIDLPSENSDSDVITITGKKASVDEAKKRIEVIQKELVSDAYVYSFIYFVQ